MKTGATLNRGASKQDYETPDDFIHAAVNRFGKIDFDLAASKLNTRGLGYFTEFDNALSQDWDKFRGNLWLNPPFYNITPWAKKCSEYQGDGQILFLVPASVGSNWFRDFVFQKSKIYFLNDRLKFKGCKDSYPKDCLLAVFGSLERQIEIWKWKKNNPKPN